jgi:hypothetical protein
VSAANSLSLYSDKLVTINRESITFRNYYFFGCGKTVAVNDINKIESLEPTIMNGKWRIWGSSGPGGWFPMDWHRPSRDRIFLLHYKNKKFQIGFTAEHSSLAENALRRLGLMRG